MGAPDRDEARSALARAKFVDAPPKFPVAAAVTFVPLAFAFMAGMILEAMGYDGWAEQLAVRVGVAAVLMVVCFGAVRRRNSRWTPTDREPVEAERIGHPYDTMPTYRVGGERWAWEFTGMAIVRVGDRMWVTPPRPDRLLASVLPGVDGVQFSARPPQRVLDGVESAPDHVKE